MATLEAITGQVKQDPLAILGEVILLYRMTSREAYGSG